MFALEWGSYRVTVNMRGLTWWNSKMILLFYEHGKAGMKGYGLNVLCCCWLCCTKIKWIKNWAFVPTLNKGRLIYFLLYDILLVILVLFSRKEIPLILQIRPESTKTNLWTGVFSKIWNERSFRVRDNRTLPEARIMYMDGANKPAVDKATRRGAMRCDPWFPPSCLLQCYFWGSRPDLSQESYC